MTSLLAETQPDIAYVESSERGLEVAVLLFTIEVRDRRHLAHVIRYVRRSEVVHGVQRVIG